MRICPNCQKSSLPVELLGKQRTVECMSCGQGFQISNLWQLLIFGSGLLGVFFIGERFGNTQAILSIVVIFFVFSKLLSKFVPLQSAANEATFDVTEIRTSNISEWLPLALVVLLASALTIYLLIF